MPSFSGSVARQFIWGLRYVDDLIRRDLYTSGSISETLFAMQDGNFNVTALVQIISGTTTVVERYRYDAYGVPTFLDASFNVLSASAFDWETLYAGYRYDSTTGLYHVRYRTYHPSLGRWMQRDPLATTETVRNRYEYAVSSPVSGFDPSGLVVILVHGVNTEARWYDVAKQGLSAHWKATKECPQEIIEFKWGQVIEAGPHGPARRIQGGAVYNATDSIAGMSKHPYMINAVNRLRSIIKELDQVYEGSNKCEPINIIAHS